MKRQPGTLITWEELNRRIQPQIERIQPEQQEPKKPPFAFVPCTPKKKKSKYLN